MRKSIMNGTIVPAIGIIIVLALFTARANAEVIVLDFEGLGDQDSIQGFYNGGTSASGASGTNFGISFSSNTLSIIDADAGGSGNFGGEPSPDTVMFFLTGASAIMNVAAGFDTGFSFFYSAINQPGSVDVFDGLDGTGNLLTTLGLPLTPFNGAPDPNGQFSPLEPLGIGFAGTAMSVSFAGVQNQIAFDDVTFGAVIPGGNGEEAPIPEPATVALLGIGLVGLAGAEVRRRRKKKSVDKS